MPKARWSLYLKTICVFFSILFISAAAYARSPIPQTPNSIRVNYALQNNELILMMRTYPPISGCGTISNLPVGGGFDTQAIDLYVGEYFFTPAKYDVRGPACGPTYKTSIGRVSVPLLDLQEKQINRIRLWSGTNLDTFLITSDGQNISLVQTPGVGFFRLGNYMLTVPDAFNRLAGPTE